MSVSHTSLGRAAVSFAAPRSSSKPAPRRPFPIRPLFVVVDHIRCSRHSRCTGALAQLAGGTLELICDEPVSELGIIGVDVAKGAAAPTAVVAGDETDVTGVAPNLC